MSRTVFIPSIGDKFVLAEPWNFCLVREFRNVDAIRVLTASHPNELNQFSFPAGTTLLVDRIYIRKGKKDYDSITFRTTVGKKSIRFWVRLNQVNQMVVVSDD